MSALQRRPGLGRNVLALGWTSLLNDAASEMIYPLLPVFLSSTLGAGTAVIGLIEGVAESISSLGKLVSGWISDRLGRRKTLVILGYALAAVSRPFVSVAQAPWHVLAVRGTDRVGKGIRGAPRDALLAASSGERDRGRAFGFQRAMDHTGAIVGPLLASGVLLLMPGSYRVTFALASIPGLLVLPVLIWGVKEQHEDEPRAREATPRTKGDGLRGTKGAGPRGTSEAAPRRAGAPVAPEANAAGGRFSLSSFSGSFKAYLAILVLFTLGNSSDAFLLLRAKELGVGAALVPILWVVLHIVKALSSVPGGIVSDRLGRRRVIAAGWLVYAGVYLGFGLAASAWQAWGLFAVYGLYFGLTEGVEKALVADMVPPRLRGTAFGLYNFAVGIAALPASLLMGAIWQRTGSALLAFGLGSGLALLSSALLLAFVRPPVLEPRGPA